MLVMSKIGADHSRLNRYFNRYPGLMCDVESYIYMPLIEEMDYVPKRKYASGHEIREYCEKLCAKYGLHDRAIFQSRVKSMTWDESAKEWVVEIRKAPKGGEESLHTLHADFTMIAPGKTVDQRRYVGTELSV